MRIITSAVVIVMLSVAAYASAEVRKALPADMPVAADDQGPATPLDVLKMSKAGLSDSVIINKIDQSGASFRLSVNDIISLKNEGVSDAVINYMINAQNAPAARRATAIPKASPVTYVVPAATVVAPAETVIVRDYYYDPPPPVSFSFGYYSGWGGGPCWRRGGWGGGWGWGHGYRRRCW
ncbi:MAG TPA: hypothetical protein P5287_07585 [bacterium]|nr:hypothetical protein [bacterium]